MTVEMPMPGPEHVELARLAGNWEGAETLGPSPFAPQGGTARGRYHARMALHDFYLLIDYEQEHEGAVTFRGHGLIGWDARTQRYVMFWFDSSGYLPSAPATGHWEGDALTLSHTGADFGHARYVWTPRNGELGMKIENSPDGKDWRTFLEGTYKRQ